MCLGTWFELCGTKNWGEVFSDGLLTMPSHIFLDVTHGASANTTSTALGSVKLVLGITNLAAVVISRW
jgi:hypothetical protein